MRLGKFMKSSFARHVTLLVFSVIFLSVFSLCDTAHANLHNFKEENPVVTEQLLWPDKNKMDV